MQTLTSQDIIQDLRGCMQRDVTVGFQSAEEIAAGAAAAICDELEECNPGEVKRHAIAIVHDLIETHKREQASWPKLTDCDRLDAAFAELERSGVVCRHNFCCCRSCGLDAIYDEMQRLKKTGKRVRGYAFYHAQDTDIAVEGNGLWLSFGGRRIGKIAAADIGLDIAAALQRQGLKVNWNGEAAVRIQVDFDWKRRR